MASTSSPRDGLATKEAAIAQIQSLAARLRTSLPATAAGDWLSFSTSVGKASELFQTNFSYYTHAPSGAQSIRALAYSLPRHLHEHVDAVLPLIE